MEQAPDSSQEVDLSVPVLKRPLHTGELIGLFENVIDGWYSEKDRRIRRKAIRYNDMRGVVRRLDEFLQLTGRRSTNVDENLVSEFAYQQKSDGMTDAQVRHVTYQIRRLVNDLPKKLLRRPMLSAADVKRLRRFDHLTPESKALLEDFLQHGRRLKRVIGSNIPLLSERLLTPASRDRIIHHALLYLRISGKNDLQLLTSEDTERFLRRYEAEDRRQSGANLLAEARPLFSNLFARGIIKSNPLAAISGREWKADGDYVPPQGIAILQDLSTVNFRDICDVRDRLISFGFCYDFALRVGEVSQLKVPDVRINDFVELTIRSEIQKGQGKPEITALSYFPETLDLLRRYLHLRNKASSGTEALLLSDRGAPLLADGCRKRVVKHCEQLGIVTHGGKVPRPHRLRHTLGTINVAPLGLQLDPYDIMRRLRHNSLETTTKIYITDNPLLARTRHEAKFGPQNGRANLSDAGSHRVEMASKTVCASTTPESEVLKQLAFLGITRAALRKYAVAHGYAWRRDGDVTYDAGFIEDIRGNYRTKQEAMGDLGINRSSLFYWLSSKGIESITIGKVSLVPREAVHARKQSG